MNSSPNSNAFVPAFYASSYDDDELEFSAEQVHSDNSVAFIAPAAPAAHFSADLAHHDLGEDDDDALFVPSTKYRDTQHVFANGPCDLVRPASLPFYFVNNTNSEIHSHSWLAIPFVSSFL